MHPNLLMLSLWLAQHTTRLKFGCGFNVFYGHPLRLAGILPWQIF